ncbi:MAG: class I SAM-dependent methyltransferase [Steroidobacteraceae bacterium]|nr:class I SAM-dependent methyltransferase [Steroidobacteraceae bacterium]
MALQKLRPFICPFERLIEHIPRGSAVLDVGCGAGLFLGLLAADHGIVRGAGFDSSPRAIALANRMRPNVPREVSLEFVVADAIESWPAAECFDVVSLIDVMHHIPRTLQSRVLSYAMDRVRPGGLLLYKDMALRPRWRGRG